MKKSAKFLTSFTKGLFVSLLVAPLFLSLSSCAYSPKPEPMEKELKQIQEKLDAALLSERPMKSFKLLLADINKYDCVDSAWIEGQAFCIQYKEGGKQFWTIPLENQNIN